MRLRISKIAKNFNCYDLNFIFIIAGFPFLTSLYANPSASLGYRAIGLLIALYCLIKPKNRPKLQLLGDYPKVYLIIVSLYWVRCLYELTFGTYQGMVIYGKTQGYLFYFGIVLFPILSFLKGFKTLHLRTCLLGIFFCIGFSLILGLGTLAMQAAEYGEDTRFQLNASQGSLAFGDNGAYMVMVSISLLFKSRYYFPKRNKIWRIIFISGAILGFASTMKAGSRGPMLSLLCALIYLVYIAKVKYKVWAIGGIVAIFIFSASTISFLKDFAPALYQRSMMSIENNDSSGRDLLFATALEEVNSHPLFGTNPMIVNNSGNYSYHNVYLNYLMGCGYLAFSAFVIFMFLLLYRVLKIKPYRANPFQLFIFTFFIFYCMRGMTGGNMFNQCNYNVAILGASSIVSFFYNKKSYIQQ